jgi:hypothetical protein
MEILLRLPNYAILPIHSLRYAVVFALKIDYVKGLAL